MIKADDVLPRYDPDHPLTGRYRLCPLNCFVTKARPRTAARWNVLEAGEQNCPNAVTKERVAEIAADFMTTYYHVQVGAPETQEFRTQSVPFWLVCFSRCGWRMFAGSGKIK